MNTSVIIEPYNPKWPKLFLQEKARLERALKGLDCSFLHIGSTSIPQLSAKPIIDILGITENIPSIDPFISKIENLAYLSKGSFGIPLRRFFQRKGNPFSVNLHFFDKSSPEVARHLIFRDWLLKHPEDLKSYEDLKVFLAKKHPHDLPQYIMGKESLIQEIEKKAGYQDLRFVEALTERELFFIKKEQEKKSFPRDLLQESPNLLKHFVFILNENIVAYAFVSLEKEQSSLLYLTVERPKLKSSVLALLELWIKKENLPLLKAPLV